MSTAWKSYAASTIALASRAAGRALLLPLITLHPYVALLVFLYSPAAAGDFAEHYAEAQARLIGTYGNGTFLVRKRIWHGSGFDVHIERALLRWPSVRFDRLDQQGNVSSSMAFSDRGLFRVRAFPSASTYLLTRFSTHVSDDDLKGLWRAALNEGRLPLVVVGWFEQPLIDYLLHSDDVEIVHENPEQCDGRAAYAVEVRQSLPERAPVRGKFWFWPEGGWVLLRWHWPYRDPSAKEGIVCELSYGEMVEGVPIVKSGRYVHLSDGSVRWQAEVISYELRPPSAEVFELAAFGLPDPQQQRPTPRLWLWTLVGVAGILTTLLLIRLAAGRPSRQHSEP